MAGMQRQRMVYSMYRRNVKTILLVMAILWPADGRAQTWAVKTNLLTDALLIPTLGAEYALNDRNTISLTATYMPFAVGDKKWKNWSLQPEFRFWRDEPYAGWFVGVNVIGGAFNINNVHVGGLYGKQRQGKMFGAGVSAGYQFVLSDYWSLELTLGVDALYCNYERILDRTIEGRYNSFTVLPIGTGISFVYILD